MSSASLLVVVAINDLRKYTKRRLPAACATLSIMIFVILTVYLEVAVAPQLTVANGVYGNARAELATLGLQNCRIVSNDWILMLYLNVSAFSEFDPNASSLSYPILLFKNATQATNIYAVRDLSSSNVIYSSYYYDVLLPPNHVCYT